MRREFHIWPAGLLVQARQYITGAVTLLLPSKRAVLGCAPFGVLPLEASRRWNAAHVQVAFVDPLPIPRESLQTRPPPALLRDIGDGNRRGNEIGRHPFECTAGVAPGM